MKNPFKTIETAEVFGAVFATNTKELVPEINATYGRNRILWSRHKVAFQELAFAEYVKNGNPNSPAAMFPLYLIVKTVKKPLRRHKTILLIEITKN